MAKGYLRTFMWYLAGVVLWMALISVLQARCILNLPLAIDRLWTKKIDNDLVVNVLGSVAYQTTGLGCGKKLIYVARYYPYGVGGEYQSKSLSLLIDTKSWHKVSSDNTSVTYADTRYRYVVCDTSDGVYMKVIDI